MDRTYNAVYYHPSGRFYSATIFLSSITLSIRYTDENNELKDVYWLAGDIISLEQEALAWVLKHKNKEGQTGHLVIRDLELTQEIKKQFSHYRFAGGWKHHVFGSTRNKILLLLVVLTTFILAGYFLFIPWLGERIARNISKEWEIRMGQSMHRSIMDQYRIDTVKTERINNFYKQLQYRINYPINITVVESKEVNAFAIPGGHIVVYTSILERMQKPEELAALLSHEAAHIELRHSLRNIFRSMARKVFLMMIIGNESGLSGFLVDNADNLKGLEYSRSLETEADNYGIRLMQSANIDPKGMLRLMEILQQEAKGKEPSKILSTHPVFQSRIENIKIRIRKTPAPYIKNQSVDSLFMRLHSGQTNSDW